MAAINRQWRDEWVTSYTNNQQLYTFVPRYIPTFNFTNSAYKWGSEWGLHNWF